VKILYRPAAVIATAFPYLHHEVFKKG